MDQYWDFSIPWRIYFCNEELDVDLPNEKYTQIKTGKKSHASMTREILGTLRDHKYVFYMLEDFWPVREMSNRTFMGLFKIFKKNEWDSLKVTINQPSFYELESTEFRFNNEKILKYSSNSRWKFNQQASFWKRDVLEQIIDDPTGPNEESKISTSLGMETATDDKFGKLFPDAQVYLFNYLWYPVGGSYWRGEINEMGKQIEFEMKVKEYNELRYR